MFKKLLLIGLFSCPIFSYADQSSLIGHTYILSTINDINVENQFKEIPYLSFQQGRNGIEVTGKVCNDFSGRIEITDGKFVSNNVLPDERFCSNAFLNKFQSSIPKWFEHSMIQEQNGILTIYTNGTVVKMKKIN